MTTPIAGRAGASTPCPVCLSPSKGCSWTDEAAPLYLCRSETPADSSAWRTIPPSPDSAGFYHYRHNDDGTKPTSPRGGKSGSAGGARQRKPRAVAVDWGARAAHYASSLRPQDRQFICAELGIPDSALAAIPLLGASGSSATNGETITFPEYDGDGVTVVGITERIPHKGQTSEKKRKPGSKCGLTVPHNWSAMAAGSKCVFVVEGASDVLAMFAAGLPAIGRPGNAAGADLLAKLFSALPSEIEIVVVGENDRKPTGLWPGRDGAVATAAKLGELLGGRPVRVAMPPPPAKDVRAWLVDPERAEMPWAERGANLKALLVSPLSAPPPSTIPVAQQAEIVTGFDEYNVNSQAIVALANHEGTFVRSGRLVHVCWQDAHELPNTSAQIPAGPQIEQLSKATLRERLTVVARFMTEKNGETGAYKMQDRPPDWCISAVLDRGHWPGISPLAAIAEFPVFLPDGSILSKPGYDKSSGLYCFPTVPVDVTVPESPTRADAEAALETLAEVVCDFPFVKNHHRSAWVAGLLTSLGRYAFKGPSPLFLVEANVPAAGKGLLTNAANIIARGEPSAVLEFSRDSEELQKVLTAILFQGESIAVFDNVEGNLGGGVLNKLLTAEMWQGRLLGSTKTVRVPNLCTWWATGNNVSVIGDTARRVCSVRLESKMENPESRVDLRHSDLPKWVQANRPRLLSAALTVLRAYHAAGRPPQDIEVWGSYVPWSDLIRAAIVWAGWDDPIGDGTEAKQVDDPVRVAMSVLLERWGSIDSKYEGLTSAGVIHQIEGLADSSNAEIKEALEILAPKNSKSRTVVLSLKLKHYLRRVLCDHTLEQRIERSRLTYWVASPVKSGEGGEGCQNDSSQPSPQKTTEKYAFGEGDEGGEGYNDPIHARAHTHAPARAHAQRETPSPPTPPSPLVNGVIDLTHELLGG